MTDENGNFNLITIFFTQNGPEVVLAEHLTDDKGEPDKETMILITDLIQSLGLELTQSALARMKKRDHSYNIEGKHTVVETEAIAAIVWSGLVLSPSSEVTVYQLEGAPKMIMADWDNFLGTQLIGLSYNILRDHV